MKKQKTWENLEVGDVLIDRNGKKRTVLGILNEIVFVSDAEISDYYEASFTKKELVYFGYFIVQDKEEEVNKEEELKKLIEETKKMLHNYIFDSDVYEDLLAKWKGVEVEKIKYIK